MAGACGRVVLSRLSPMNDVQEMDGFSPSEYAQTSALKAFLGHHLIVFALSFPLIIVVGAALNPCSG